MTVGQYNLEELFAIAFRGIPYSRIDTARKMNEAEPFNTIEPGDFKNQGTSKLLGTPLFMPCQLDDFMLPNEPLIELSFSKTIIKTPIDAHPDKKLKRKGSFKELFAMEDYVITIRGIAVQEDGTQNYPEEQIRRIKELITKAKNIRVTNRLCEYFDVDKLVIESGTFPGLEGHPGAQPYQFNCSSDDDFDIEKI